MHKARAHLTTEGYQQSLTESVGRQLQQTLDWPVFRYFPAPFPTRGLSGHLEQRAFSLSLELWALKHHSRRYVPFKKVIASPVLHSNPCRFARHKTFMYLVYDVLQLQKASLGNSLLVQRQHWRSAEMILHSTLTEDRLHIAMKVIKTGHQVEDPLILRLLHIIETVAVRAPASFALKLSFRTEIRRYGMPAFWIPINPQIYGTPGVGCHSNFSHSVPPTTGQPWLERLSSTLTLLRW
jgi:hypothetical protein